MGEKVYKIG